MFHSEETLSWRIAARELIMLGREIGLGGDLFEHIAVEGVPGWAADVLRMCWIEFESPYFEQREHLLALSDAEIEQIWSLRETLFGAEAASLIVGPADSELLANDEASVAGYTTGKVIRKGKKFSILEASADHPAYRAGLLIGVRRSSNSSKMSADEGSKKSNAPAPSAERPSPRSSNL